MSTENKTEQKLTHWKKNNDSRYISGEDLQGGINLGKGLRPTMVVSIERFEDSETFDQNQNSKVMKTGFWLKDLETGKMLYKPVILNNTNARFCINEFKSEYMEHWIGKPLVLYAKADKRHGFVARFRKHIPKSTVSPDKAIEILSSSVDLEELKSNWSKLSKEEQSLPAVVKNKEDLKTQLS